MVKFHGENPGKGDTGFVRNIAGYVQLAAERARGLAGSLRTCGTEVGESWRGDAHTAWDGHLTAQAAVVEALAPQWETISTALTTYADAVEDIHARGEGFRDTIDADLASAASQGMSVTCYPDSVDMRGVTVRVPKETGPVEDPAGRMAKEAEASRLQSSINGELAKFWALEEERDTANSAVTSAISTNLPAGWETLKATYPAGTDPRTMLPAVPKEFYGYDGIDAAKDVAAMVDPKTGIVDPEAWTFINDHIEDPIFREHCMVTLGPERAIVLGLDARITNNAEGDDSKLKDLRILMMAGAPPARYDGAWVSKAESTIDGLPIHTAPHRATTILADIVGTGCPVNVGGTPMPGNSSQVMGGTEIAWNQGSLAMLANTVLVGWQGYRPYTDWDASTVFFGALGNNTGAAAIAFGGNPEAYLEAGKTMPPGATGAGFNDAYANFLRAATVTAAGDPEYRGMADHNVTFIIDNVGASGDNQRFTDETRGVFGEIAGAYWDDFIYSVGSRWELIDDPLREGVECSTSTWGNFLLEGMRDPDVGANVQIWLAESYNEANSGSTWSDADAANPISGSPGTYLDTALRADLEAIRRSLLGTLIGERTEYQNEVNASIGEIVDFGASMLEGPKGAVEGLAKDAAKDLIKQFLEYEDEDLKKYQNLDVSLQKSMTSWEGAVREVNDEAARLRASGKPEATAYSEVYVVRDGVLQPFDGDPSTYEKRATAAAHAGGDYGASVKFTNADGTLRDSKEMRDSDPRAYAAYIEWLRDPSVQAAVNQAAADGNLSRNPLGK